MPRAMSKEDYEKLIKTMDKTMEQIQQFRPKKNITIKTHKYSYLPIFPYQMSKGN